MKNIISAKQMFIVGVLIFSMVSCSNHAAKNKAKQSKESEQVKDSLNSKTSSKLPPPNRVMKNQYSHFNENKPINDSLKFKLVGEPLPSHGRKSQSLVFKNVQTIITNLNNDGIPDTIFLDKIIKSSDSKGNVHEWADGGNFHRIRISLSGGRQQIWFNINGWVTTDDLTVFDTTFNRINAVHSNYVTIRKNQDKGALIFCEGFSYGENPRCLTILKIKGNKAHLVFNKEAFLVRFGNLNGNKEKVLVTSLFCRYIPPESGYKVEYKVYTLQGGFHYNKELSKSFGKRFNNKLAPLI